MLSLSVSAGCEKIKLQKYNFYSSYMFLVSFRYASNIIFSLLYCVMVFVLLQLNNYLVIFLVVIVLPTKNNIIINYQNQSNQIYKFGETKQKLLVMHQLFIT